MLLNMFRPKKAELKKAAPKKIMWVVATSRRILTDTVLSGRMSLPKERKQALQIILPRVASLSPNLRPPRPHLRKQSQPLLSLLDDHQPVRRQRPPTRRKRMMISPSSTRMTRMLGMISLLQSSRRGDDARMMLMLKSPATMMFFLNQRRRQS